MEKQYYSLHGIFFQQDHALGVDYKVDIGTAATIQNIMKYYMFYGIVTTDESRPHTLSGVMTDQFGESTISNFTTDETGASFVKNYAGRLPISYYFTKKTNNIWHGRYKGIDCGEGVAKLIVTPIEESFFFPGNEQESF